MPSKHRYKCLNLNRCPSYERKSLTPIFVSMNSPQPTCPWCGSIKLEDWGEAINMMVATTGEAKRIDTGLREIADQYGMTNMSNKGGKGVKAVTGEARGDYGKYTVAPGVTIPVDRSSTCSRVPMTSKVSVKPGERAVTQPRANVLSGQKV